MLVVPRPIVIDGTAPRLRTLRALAFASVIAPLVAFGAYAIVSYYQSFRAAEARASHISALLQEHGERVFETIALALTDVRALLSSRTDGEIKTSKEIWELVRSRQTAGPQLGSVFVIGPDGVELLTSRAFPAPPVDFSDRDYFIAQKYADAGLYLSAAYVGKISHIPIFNFSIRRTYADGRFAGVVGSSGFVEYFKTFYSTVGDPEDDFAVALMRSDGDVLVRYPAVDVGNKAKLDFVVNSPAARQIGYRISSIDGKNRLYATSKLGQYPAFVSYTIGTAAIRSQWAADLIIPGATTLLAIAFLSGLSWIAIYRARREGAAIHELTETSHNLKRETERRQKAESSLLQAQKLDAIGRLTSGIAHDFNNLLTIILGNVALLKKRIEAPSTARLLNAAEEAAKRGATLTGQLLTFSRVQSLQPSNVDLNEVLAKAKSWIGQAVTERVEMKLETGAGPLPVRVDIAQFEAALLNLVVNARDAMQGSGVVHIRSFVAHAPLDTPVSLRPGDYAVVSVADTGAGIPEDIITKIFEPFFTTKALGKGTGLGLSQVHGFVRQSGGDVAIDTRKNAGTRITLFFPLESGMELRSPSEIANPPVEKKEVSRVVLVVEDENEIRKLTVEMLHDLGHTPLIARSSKEALGLLSGGGHIDVLITDVGLSGSDGTALAGDVMRLYPQVKVLLATAFLQIDNPAGHPVLRKPFDKQALDNALNRLYSAELDASHVPTA
jgi:two-component system, NtrC family, sensor kinase